MSIHRKHGDREGARQPERFDPGRAAILDDPERFDYLPPAEVFALLDAPVGGLVVDFGAGTGVYAIELARTRPDLTVTALDEQPEMLDMMRAKPAVAACANLKLAMPDEIAALSGQVDRVLALNVLHELGDAAMRSLAALLKPASTALFIDWNAQAQRPVGPPTEHVYAPAQARARIEAFALRAESERLLRYHYAIVARRP